MLINTNRIKPRHSKDEDDIKTILYFLKTLKSEELLEQFKTNFEIENINTDAYINNIKIIQKKLFQKLTQLSLIAILKKKLI